MKRKMVLLAGLAVAAASLYGSSGKLNLSAAYNGCYSNNIFMNASAVDDYISRLSAGIDLSFNALMLSLSASSGLYSENPEFNSFHIQPSVQWFQRLKGRDGLYIGLSYDVLDYREIYTDFNYHGPGARAELKLYSGQHTIIRLGYKFQHRKYPNYKSFDFSNHNVFVRWNRFFRGQTTLVLQAGFNYRNYPHIAEDVDFGSGYNYFQNMGNNGMGYGYGSDDDSGSGNGDNGGNGGNGHGQGPGHGEGNNPGQPPWFPGLDGPSHSLNIPNLYLSAGLEQGLGHRAGFNANVELRKNIRGLDFEDARSLIKNAYIIYPLNDDFLWDGVRIKLILKMVLLKSLAMHTQFSYAKKSYPGVFIMDENGSVLYPRTERDDSLAIYSLEFSKRFSRFTLTAYTAYQDNRSNDDFFHYTMLTFSAGIGYHL